MHDVFKVAFGYTGLFGRSRLALQPACMRVLIAACISAVRALRFSDSPPLVQEDAQNFTITNHGLVETVHGVERVGRVARKHGLGEFFVWCRGDVDVVSSGFKRIWSEQAETVR